MLPRFIEKLDFDGIRFNSSLNSNGKNVTIFTHQACLAVGSKLYGVKDICFEAEPVAPLDGSKLCHKDTRKYHDF